MPEVRLLAPVKATLVDDIVAADVPAGGYKFWIYRATEPEGSEPAGLNFRCPCGCGAMHGIAWRRYDGKPGGWTWDGNREAPTCTPSIQTYNNDGSPHWHGYLTQGEWRQA